MACPDPLELDALARGSVNDARRGPLLAHLDGCRSCAQLVAELARSRSVSASSGSIAFGETAPARTIPSVPPGPPVAMVGRYRLLRRLGSGGMGTVFEAFDPELDRRVAIKVLHPDRSGDLQTVRALLLREAQAMARLNHPNVVAVYDVGTTGHQLFIAMELVHGSTLEEAFARPKPRADVLTVFVDAGRGLAAAHAAGLVHRDFKPANVLVGADGRVRVSDFGLARNPFPSGGGSAPTLTHAGSIVGTPAYMSPEQWLGQPADARSDQFSFGAALFEALSGSAPFAGKSLGELRESVLLGRRAPTPADLPRHVRTVLDRTLQIRPDARYPSMEALLTDLDRGGASLLRRALPWAVLVVGAGALTAAIAVVVSGERGAASSASPSVCADADAAVDAVWNADRRAALKAKVPEGTLVASVEEYATAWRAMRKEVCELAARKEESDDLRDRRNVCLDRRLAQLDGALRAIDKGTRDPAAVFAGVPPVADCADRERVMSGIFLPQDPDKRKKVEEIHAKLSDAVVLLDAQRLAEAEPVIDGALAEATALGWDPLIAEAQYRRASLFDRRGDARGAEKAFKLAYATARAARHDEVTRAASVQLVSVIGADLGRPADAEEWIVTARAEVKRAPHDKVAEAKLLEHEAAIDLKTDRAADAKVKLEKVLSLREAELGADAPDVGTARSNLAAALVNVGDLGGALDQRKRALAIMEKAYGKDNPKTADYMLNVAKTHHARGELDETLEISRAALAVLERWEGTESLASIANEYIGRVLRDREQAAAALPHMQKAATLREAALGPDHPSVGDILGELAGTYEDASKAAEGLASVDRSIAILEKFYGPSSVDSGDAHAQKGGLLVALKRYDEAIAEYERAIHAVESSAGAGHKNLGRHAFNLGRAKKFKGDYEGALVAYRRAVEATKGAYPAHHKHVIHATLATAWLLMDELQRPAEAIPLFEAAVVSCEATYGVDAKKTRDTRAALEQAKRRANK